MLRIMLLIDCNITAGLTISYRIQAKVHSGGAGQEEFIQHSLYSKVLCSFGPGVHQLFILTLTMSAPNELPPCCG